MKHLQLISLLPSSYVTANRQLKLFEEDCKNYLYYEALTINFALAVILRPAERSEAGTRICYHHEVFSSFGGQ